MCKKKDKNFIMRVNSEDFELLKVITSKNGLSVSEFLRLLIESTIVDYKKKGAGKNEN